MTSTKTFLAAAASALAVAGSSIAQTETAPIEVTTHGLVARIFLPATTGARHPGILVIGGSEGGLQGSSGEARLLAKDGYVTMALAYFAAPGLPDQLTNIPLEYFKTALDVLRARPEVDPARIGLVGGSKGGEAVLLIASRSPEVKVVVAAVPSSVVWQGINMKNYADPSGSWTEAGKPVAFLPYDSSGGFDPGNIMKSIHAMYALSLTHIDAHPEAAIPVERIAGSVMLICGEADGLWPSCPMSEVVVARLKTHGFRHRVEFLHYPNAGHAAFGSPIPADSPRVAELSTLGGDIPGNLAARVDGWAKARAFLAETLKP